MEPWSSGAAVPFGVAMLLGWRLPGRLWMAVAGALIFPVFWIFGRPSWPLKGSDDTAVAGLVAATLLVALETARKWSGARRAMLRALVWTSLGWLLYPAWLAAEGGVVRRLLVAGAMGLSIAGWAALVEFLAREKKGENEGAFRITPATWVPPSIALSVLLQFGGSTRFAQCSGALAAATGGVCLLLIFGKGQAGLRPARGPLWNAFRPARMVGLAVCGDSNRPTLALLLSSARDSCSQADSIAAPQRIPRTTLGWPRRRAIAGTAISAS
jgi:hypothetical protein